jgi:hypothetical protein
MSVEGCGSALAPVIDKRFAKTTPIEQDRLRREMR